MLHEVTRRLPLTADVTPAEEFSFGVAMHGRNAASFLVQLLSADGAFTLVGQLQGTNDLSNWENIGTASLTLSTAPELQTYAGTGVIPWAYVRLKYTATAAGPVRLMLKAAIELFDKN